MDALRRYGVLLDWGTGKLLPRSTGQFRAAMRRRAAAYWAPAGGAAEWRGQTMTSPPLRFIVAPTK